MSYIHYQNPDLSNNDFNVLQYGFRDCPPYFNVCYLRPHNYIFHYVYSGKGTLFCNGKTYDLSENTGFFMFPGLTARYLSDGDFPYSYAWIEFSGSKAVSLLHDAGICETSPAFKINAPYKSGQILKDLIHMGSLSRLALTGMFYLFANELVAECSLTPNSSDALFRAAQSYIHENIDKHTTVGDVCRALGVSRSYLSKIFAQCCGQSPKQYILLCHMDEAKSLLTGTSLRISEIAASVGYANPTDFTKAFVRFDNQSPSQYRKKYKI